MVNVHFTPFPVLQTERLILRKMKQSDDEAVFLLRSDDRVNKYLDRKKAASINDARQFIENINAGIDRNENFYWAIALKESDQLIGTICFWNIDLEKDKAEIGYELLPEMQGKGLMQEALEKILGFGFHAMNLSIIEGWLRSDNARSIKSLERNNFTRDYESEKLMSEKDVSDKMVIYTLKKPHA